MVSEMVERVARAMLAKLVADDALWRAMEDDDDLHHVPVDASVDLAGVARAALEAMREPTEVMVTAAKIWPTAPDDFEQDIVMGNMDGVGIYRAMIGAALQPDAHLADVPKASHPGKLGRP